MKPTIEQVGRECWQQSARAFDDYNYRQVWEFGTACAGRLGALSEHVAIRAGGGVIGLADVRIKRLPLMSAGIAYVTGGPLVRREQDSDAERLRQCLAALVDEYVHQRGLTLRILAAPGSSDWNAAQSQVFEDAGFGVAQHWPGYRTLMVDIAGPEATIRKNLRKNGGTA